MSFKSLTLLLSLAVMPSSWAIERTIALIGEKGRGLKACEVYTELTFGGSPNGIAGVQARLENKMHQSPNAFCPQVEFKPDIRIYVSLLVKKKAGATIYTGNKDADKIEITEKDNLYVVKETRAGNEGVLYSAVEGASAPEVKQLDAETLAALDLVATHCASDYEKIKGKNIIRGGTSTSKVEKTKEGTTVTQTYVFSFFEIHFPKGHTLAPLGLEVVESTFQPKGLNDRPGLASVECKEVRVFE